MTRFQVLSMRHWLLRWLASLSLLSALWGGATTAQESTRSPEEWLTWFSQQWKEDGWSASTSQRRPAYMRSLDDQGWQTRMLAMQKLVAAGPSSIPALLEVLQQGDVPARILAAQTLGYLAPDVPLAPLWKAAESDADPAVRLYAVDSLGMQGGVDLSQRLGELRDKESNGDVKKHMAYATERNTKRVSSAVVKTLVGWDAATIDSARIGEPAPDFQLSTVSGKAVRLSQYRDKKNVVLVFIYGDT